MCRVCAVRTHMVILLTVCLSKFIFVEAATFQTASNTNTAYPLIPKLPAHLRQTNVQAAFHFVEASF